MYYETIIALPYLDWKYIITAHLDFSWYNINFNFKLLKITSDKEMS